MLRPVRSPIELTQLPGQPERNVRVSRSKRKLDPRREQRDSCRAQRSIAGDRRHGLKNPLPKLTASRRIGRRGDCSQRKLVSARRGYEVYCIPRSRGHSIGKLRSSQ